MNQSLALFNESPIGQMLGRLPNSRKAGLAALIVAAVAGLVFFVTWSQAPEYTTAFTDLSGEDGAAIVEYLKENGIPYQLSAGGSTIRVPSNQVYETRLALAGEGLPGEGTLGFELFDSTSLGMTDFTQQVNYQRALEGELARTIGSLKAVRSARVHIVMPQDSLYSNEEGVTTASVVLELEEGQGVNQEQVRAISHLVSSAVEGLKPENLTIVDVDGNVLSDGNESPAASSSLLTGSQLQTQRGLEQDLERRVNSMLENVLGPGRAVVRVSANMNWNQVETESETYQPGDAGRVLRSSREVHQVEGDAATVANGGVPGIGTNLPNETTAYTGVLTDTNGNIVSTQSDITNNYEVSRSVSRIVEASGQVERLSISVMVDNITDTVTLDAIRQATMAAAGIDESRGDTISVSSVTFDRSFYDNQEASRAATQQRNFYLQLAQWGAIAVALIALFLVVRGLQRNLRPAPVQIIEQVDSRTALLDQVTRVTAIASEKDEEEDDVTYEPSNAEPQLPPWARMAAQQPTLPDGSAQVLRQLQNIAEQRPDSLAQIIQFWLAEDGVTK